MKVKRIISIALAVVVISFVAPAYASAQPPALPHSFWGTLLINGSDAPVGTIVEARGADASTIVLTIQDNPIVDNPIVTTELGWYGGPDWADQKLAVQGTITDGTPITFWVNGRQARILSIDGEPADPETKEYGWHSGWITELDLTVTIPFAPTGPGGGGPAPDTTPPSISAVSLCPVGVTETTADICWITNERSTSQVEYWASPGMLSTLDETLVTDHHVNLAGLTPATTYHYKTMSVDAAGNLAVSPEYTFTTLGKPPIAAFTSSDLAISPSEVNIGETVTIRVSVTNTGTASGSYEVTLKIEDVVVATEEVTLDAGASKEVTFTTSKDVAGSYSVAVNGLSGSFTVKEEVAPPPPPVPPPPEVKPPFNWPLVGGIIGAVIVVGLLIFFLVRRRAY